MCGLRKYVKTIKDCISKSSMDECNFCCQSSVLILVLLELILSYFTIKNKTLSKNSQMFFKVNIWYPVYLVTEHLENSTLLYIHFILTSTDLC